MIRQTFPVGLLACNCTILGDETSRQALVVDPGDQVRDILDRLGRLDLRLIAILVTHAHFDHIGGAAELKRLTGAPVFLNPNDLTLASRLDEQLAMVGLPAAGPFPHLDIDGELRAAQPVQLGPYKLQVLETPGHTEGSVGLYLPEERLLLAGDTLFAGSIGRTDFPGGDYKQIMASLHGTLLALPDDTHVVCGHGPETSIARERATNPFLR